MITNVADMIKIVEDIIENKKSSHLINPRVMTHLLAKWAPGKMIPRNTPWLICSQEPRGTPGIPGKWVRVFSRSRVFSGGSLGCPRALGYKWVRVCFRSENLLGWENSRWLIYIHLLAGAWLGRGLWFGLHLQVIKWDDQKYHMLSQSGQKQLVFLRNVQCFYKILWQFLFCCGA